MKKNEIRSGSALVVVLGMMAVLMIMAVAFSVFMRTERSGMTNLKHALTARQTTHTAIARAMAAIDQSFVHPTNNWPVPDWDPPYISSWNNSTVNTQFWQNAQNASDTNRISNARVLTEEISRHLSPSQLALAKNAKVDWVTVMSGVGASEATTAYGPKNDMIVARYAFIAFNTTGLLDMNYGPMTNGTDAAKKAAIENTSFVKYLKKEGSPDFIDKREELGNFSSYAEMWRALLGNKRYSYETRLEADDVVTPDLFNTFSLSMDEVDPDGKMKLYMPPDTSKSTFTDAKKTTYAKLAVEKFERLFKDENAYLRAATAGALTEVKISSTPLPDMTRAQLAAQSLVDYIDEDSKPNGGIWIGAGANPLNYPCTESVPMVTQALAQFNVAGPSEVKTDPDPWKWYKEYTVSLDVMCRAEYLGDKPLQGTYSLQGDFELVSLSDDVFEVWLDMSQPAASQTHEVWIDGVNYATPAGPAAMKTFVAKTSLSPVNSSGSALYLASGTKSFKVRARPKSVDTSEPQPLVTYYGVSRLQDNNNLKEVLSEIRISAKVVGPGVDGTVQEVPAPALTALITTRGADPYSGAPLYNNDYRIRVDGGLNPPRSSGQTYKTGWALCLDPRFAYNTKSIYGYPSGGYNMWLTGEMCNDTPLALKDPNVSQSVLGLGGNYQPMWDVAARLNALELADNIVPGGTDQRNKLIELVLFRNFGGGGGSLSADDARQLMDAFTGQQRTYPDVFHSEAIPMSGGKMFIDNGEDKPKAMPFKGKNLPMTSLNEFGNLLIGPWETLSLFATFAPGGQKIDFHRVSDYFCLNEARFPKATDIPAAGIDTINEEYLSGLHNGKLNLNAQFKVKCDDDYTGSGVPADEYNYEPLAVVLSSVTNATGAFSLSFNAAKNVALDFYETAAVSGASTENTLMFRNVSDLGNVNVQSNASPVLAAVMAETPMVSDGDRELFIGSALDRLTTRGQTYTVVVRADAYTPKYGSTSPLGGTTLATEYALLELWRDSEPNRMPNGDYFPNPMPNSGLWPPGEAPPVHGWVIRSCRFFSP